MCHLLTNSPSMTAQLHCAAKLKMESMCTPTYEQLCNRWRSTNVTMTPKRPDSNTQTKSSLKGDITWVEKAKERWESFTGAVCCSNKGTLLPRLQQSWCSRGRCSTVHTGRKQLFAFPQGSSHLCHTDTVQVSSVVKRKQKQELLKF